MVVIQYEIEQIYSQSAFLVAIHTTKRKERLPTFNEMSALISKLTRIDSLTN